MSVLKFRDENGVVYEVPTIKGDKGEKGDQGNPGIDGVDGTHAKFLYRNTGLTSTSVWGDIIDTFKNEKINSPWSDYSSYDLLYVQLVSQRNMSPSPWDRSFNSLDVYMTKLEDGSFAGITHGVTYNADNTIDGGPRLYFVKLTPPANPETDNAASATIEVHRLDSGSATAISDYSIMQIIGIF